MVILMSINVNLFKMKERILQLIEAEKTSAAEFADRIGVQRSNVSHILNGRNNPGFSFIQKILETFPKINSRWLLTGEGEMYEGKVILSENKSKTNNLFTVQTPDVKASNEVKQESRTADLFTDKQGVVNKSDRIIEGGEVSKKVVKVLFFYDDHTFEDFLPAQKL
jgi:transcriptional regulator with XRE-family HTH domain